MAVPVVNVVAGSSRSVVAAGPFGKAGLSRPKRSTGQTWSTGKKGSTGTNGFDGANGVKEPLQDFELNIGENELGNGKANEAQVEESLDEVKTVNNTMKNGGANRTNVVAVGLGEVKTIGGEREYRNEVRPITDNLLFDELEVPIRIQGCGLSPLYDDSGPDNEPEETPPHHCLQRRRKERRCLPRREDM